jgi:hypothetical protein
MFKKKKNTYDIYFDRNWIEKHSRHHSYSERFEIVKEQEFINGLKSILQELETTKQITNNNYTGFAIREKDGEIVFEFLTALNNLYRVYKDRNYLYSNYDVWIRIDNDLMFQIELTADYTQGDYVYLTTSNDTNCSVIVDYIDIVEQREDSNKSNYKDSMALKEIKRIMSEYKLNTDEVKSLIESIEISI